LVDLFANPSDLVGSDFGELHKVWIGGRKRRREEEWVRERRKECGEVRWSGKVGWSTVRLGGGKVGEVKRVEQSMFDFGITRRGALRQG